MATKILYGKFQNFVWLRCEGNGDFRISPTLKKCTKQAQEEGESLFVIDLEECKFMDSTFMGFLAGLAKKLPKGAVQIASISEENLKSLEDLGLDYILEIDPKDAPWKGHEDEIRATLHTYASQDSNKERNVGERAKHVLQAHRALAGMSKQNAKEFEKVIEILEKQVASNPVFRE